MIQYEIVDSTNACVKRAWRSLVPGEGILALHQTAGRGRLGRTWDSENTGVYLSVYLPSPPEMLPLRAAVAVCEALPVDVKSRVKWPNDIVLPRGKGWAKVCGILCEGFEGGAVAGIGVNLRFEGEPPVPHAGCLSEFCTPPRPEILGEAIRQALLRWLCPDAATVLRRYEPLCVTLGRTVRLPDGCEGTASGLDREGRLLVTAGGWTRAVGAGEVVVQNIY